MELNRTSKQLQELEKVHQDLRNANGALEAQDACRILQVKELTETVEQQLREKTEQFAMIQELKKQIKNLKQELAQRPAEHHVHTTEDEASAYRRRLEQQKHELQGALAQNLDNEAQLKEAKARLQKQVIFFEDRSKHYETEADGAKEKLKEETERFQATLNSLIRKREKLNADMKVEEEKKKTELGEMTALLIDRNKHWTEALKQCAVLEEKIPKLEAQRKKNSGKWLKRCEAMEDEFRLLTSWQAWKSYMFERQKDICVHYMRTQLSQQAANMLGDHFDGWCAMFRQARCKQSSMSEGHQKICVHYMRKQFAQQAANMLGDYFQVWWAMISFHRPTKKAMDKALVARASRILELDAELCVFKTLVSAEMLAAIKHTVEADRERANACAVCENSAALTALVHCGHCFCSTCALTFQVCPTCQEPVKATQKLFQG